MAERELKCLRCGAEMAFQRRVSLMEREGAVLFVAEYTMDVDLYTCPACGKIEFFRPGVPGGGGTDTTGYYRPGVGPDIKCPQCGKMHPSDDPFCPLCGLRKQEPKHCAWCGEEISSATEVCPRCGARQTVK